MPKLNREKIVEYRLPSSTADDVATIKIDENLTAEKVLSFASQEQSPEASIAGLASLIKGWNFTDDEGNLLPVTPDNVKLLQVADFKFLNDRIGELVESQMGAAVVPDEEKKS